MKQYMKKVFKPVAAERIDVIADLMIRLVGETIKGKLLRAVLVGTITAASQYAKEPPDAPAPSATVATSQAPSK